MAGSLGLGRAVRAALVGVERDRALSLEEEDRRRRQRAEDQALRLQEEAGTRAGRGFEEALVAAERARQREAATAQGAFGEEFLQPDSVIAAQGVLGGQKVDPATAEMVRARLAERSRLRSAQEGRGERVATLQEQELARVAPARRVQLFRESGAYFPPEAIRDDLAAAYDFEPDPSSALASTLSERAGEAENLADIERDRNARVADIRERILEGQARRAAEPDLRSQILGERLEGLQRTNAAANVEADIERAWIEVQAEFQRPEDERDPAVLEAYRAAARAFAEAHPGVDPAGYVTGRVDRSGRPIRRR